MSRRHYIMTHLPHDAQVGYDSFGFLIQLLARKLDATMKGHLAAHGLEVRHFALLMSLLHQDGVNQREIGYKLDFPEYYTSRNIDALVKSGLVERRADPKSRRSFLIYLTAKGRDIAGELPQIVASVNDEFLVGFSAQERAQMVQMLQKVAATKAK